THSTLGRFAHQVATTLADRERPCAAVARQAASEPPLASVAPLRTVPGFPPDAVSANGTRPMPRPDTGWATYQEGGQAS
ncbi:MAG: chromosome partitioning protein, partial [Pseudonocardiaceae bacterium]